LGNLKDYSGPFKQDVKLTDFTPKLLAQAFRDVSILYGLSSTFYVGMDMTGFKASNGDEVQPMSFQLALERNRLFWYQICPHECRVICRRFNIRIGDGTIADLLKFWQLSPTVGTEKHVTCELKDEKHGIITMHQCLAMEQCEETNNLELMHFMCDEMSVAQFQYTAWMFNPKIKCVPLKLPPRKSKDEPACVFEVTMMDKLVDKKGYKAWQELIQLAPITEGMFDKYLGE
jgi:hypothetical protein